MTQNGTTSPSRDPLELSPEVREVYRQILRGQSVPAELPGLAELLRLGLVFTDPERPDSHCAVDPYRAGRRLLRHARLQMKETADFLAAIPDFFDDLEGDFRAARVASMAGVTVENLMGGEVINARIAELLGRAKKELLTAQPNGPRSPDELEVSIGRDTDALARGVAMKTLYHANARTGGPTRQWVDVMTSRGAQVRTLEKPFMRAIIIDREHAFIEDFHHRPNDEAEPDMKRACLIHDPVVCSFVAEVFLRDFRRADPWYGKPSDEGTVTTPIQRSILRDMCEGKDQRQAGDRHGISERTVNKHLADLRKRLNFDTQAQLIYWWALSPERDLD